MSTLRNRCLSREHLVGAFSSIPHPVAVEIMAASGLDFLCVDWEHAQISRERIEDLIRAADVHGIPALVRVPGHDAIHISAVLDAGAAGVLVPRVSSADQARAIVAATRYPPAGERGVGPGRAAAYGYKIGEWLAKANDATLLAIQIETAAGLAEIEDISAVDGIDLIFIGPGDLSVSIAAMGPEGSERLQTAIERISLTAGRVGRPVGIFAATVDDVKRHSQNGLQFFIMGSDGMFLGSALAKAVSSAKEGILRA